MWGVLFQWLGGAIASVLSYFGISIAKKAALGAAAVAASIALFLALAAAIHGLMSGLFSVLPSWASHAGILLPGNLGPCISAYWSAKFARAFYEWNLTNLKIVSTIN